ncbi:MAG: hypothetical protein SGCHY_002748 [Lobulomycetales sp.]
MPGATGESSKYYNQRFSLFSRFAHPPGILLDKESWYSVTPERIAVHIAQKAYSCISNTRFPACTCGGVDLECPCRAGLAVLDAFSGAGGNTIQFALHAPPGSSVTAIDTLASRHKIARHNASVYEIPGPTGAAPISYITASVLDYLHADCCPRFDVVFMSPPWGGPGYSSTPDSCWNPETDMPGGLVGSHLLHLARRALAPGGGVVVLYMPRNVDLDVMKRYGTDSVGCKRVQLESVVLDGRQKALLAWYFF